MIVEKKDLSKRLYVSCPICSTMLMQAHIIDDGIIKCERCHKKIWIEIKDGKVTSIPLSLKKWVANATHFYRYKINPNQSRVTRLKFGLFWFGGAKGIRTPDLCVANASLYQLSHNPTVWDIISYAEIICKYFKSYFVCFALWLRAYFKCNKYKYEFLSG